MRQPLDPFSKVLDERSHWDPEWYSWLREAATAVTRLETAVPPTVDLAGITAQITALQAQVATLEATSPPGLVFLSRQAVTTPIAFVAFTGLTTAYDTYIFEGANIRASADASMALQVSINNGASWITSGSYWQNILYGFNVAASTDSHAFDAAHDGLTLLYCGHAVDYASRTDTTGNFTIKVRGVAVSGLLSNFDVSSGHYHNANGQMSWVGKGITGFTGVNAIRFFSTAGNLTSGSIALYGMRKT